MAKIDYEKANRRIIPDNVWETSGMGKATHPVFPSQEVQILELQSRLGESNKGLGNTKTAEGAFHYTKSLIRRLESKYK